MAKIGNVVLIGKGVQKHYFQTRKAVILKQDSQPSI